MTISVGVMGYYGFGNAGDEVILKTLKNFLAPNCVVAFPTGFQPSPETIDRLNSFDLLILGGGGLFNRVPTSPFDTFEQWMDRLQVPIGVLGLGVEKLEAPYIAAVHKLADRAHFFIVRDEESRRLIGHPRVQAAPDLTFYDPLCVKCDQPASEGTALCGVNLRPRLGGVSHWIQAIANLPCKKRAIPLSVVPAFDDREPLSALDPDCPRQFNTSAYESLHVMIGTAFHSIVFAIQNGIPAIAIDYHPKVRRLMEEAGLHDYVLNWDEWDRLQECYDRMLSNRDRIRDQMLNFTARAHEEIRRVLQEVRQSIDEMEANSGAAAARLPQEQTVSIIVGCKDATDTSLARTVQSCLNQTHQNVEVVLVADAKNSEEIANQLQDDDRVRLVQPTDGERDWVTTGLNCATGNYVTWLKAGTWYADDTIGLLAKLVAERPAVDVAYSDFFLTNSGIIERKVDTRAQYSVDEMAPVGPCFVTRSATALALRASQSNAERGEKAPERWRERALHVAHPLFFTPATESRVYLYRSAIAYGRGQGEKGKQLLERASTADPRLLASPQAKRAVFQFYWNTPFEIFFDTDRVAYLHTICENLPSSTRELRSFRREFLAQASISAAFALRGCAEKEKVRGYLLYGIRHDPRWILNRGVLSVMVETLAGSWALSFYRQARRGMHRVFSHSRP